MGVPFYVTISDVDQTKAVLNILLFFRLAVQCINPYEIEFCSKV